MMSRNMDGLQLFCCLLLCLSQLSRACFPNPASNVDYVSICGADLCGGGVLPPAETSTALAAASLAQEILEFTSEFPVIGSFSHVGAGVLNFAGTDQTAPWTAKEMQANLNVLQEYLVCKMSVLQKETITKVDKMFKDQVLDKFNSAMRAFQSSVAENCQVWNCLSEIDLPPSQRSGTCAAKQQRSADVCKTVTAWDSKSPVECPTDRVDRVGYCDPNGSCYTTTGWEVAANQVQKILDAFVSKDSVDNFNVFNSYLDPAATVAMTKGSLVKLLMLQQLFMLGEANSKEALVGYLNDIAKRLEDRYNAHLDMKTLTATANKLSYGNYEKIAVDCGKPTDSFKNVYCFSDFFPSPYGDGTTISYLNTSPQKDAPTQESYILSNQIMRPSCDASTFVTPTNIYCPIGSFERCGSTTYCPEATTKCVNDKLYPNLQAASQCTKTLLDLQKAEIDKGVEAVYDTLKQTLAPVMDMVQAYKKMSALGGMNQEYFGYFKNKGYPKASCGPAMTLAPQVGIIATSQSASLVNETALAPASSGSSSFAYNKQSVVLIVLSTAFYYLL